MGLWPICTLPTWPTVRTGLKGPVRTLPQVWSGPMARAHTLRAAWYRYLTVRYRAYGPDLTLGTVPKCLFITACMHLHANACGSIWNGFFIGLVINNVQFMCIHIYVHMHVYVHINIMPTLICTHINMCTYMHICAYMHPLANVCVHWLGAFGPKSGPHLWAHLACEACKGPKAHGMWYGPYGPVMLTIVIYNLYTCYN